MHLEAIAANDQGLDYQRVGKNRPLANDHLSHPKLIVSPQKKWQASSETSQTSPSPRDT